MKNKGVYVPKKKKGGRSSSSSQQQGGESRQEGQQVDNNKQRGKNRVRFSFNFDADDDDAEVESGHYDGSMAAPTKNKKSNKRATEATNAVSLSLSSSSVCQVVLMLMVAIILGIVLFAFAPLNISSIFIRGQGKEDDGTVVFDSDYSSTERGQEMLELAEQINIACEIINYSTGLNYNQRNCPISLTRFTPGQEIMRIRYCGHIFIPSHLRQWFSLNTRCPVCRYDIRTYHHRQTNH